MAVWRTHPSIGPDYHRGRRGGGRVSAHGMKILHVTPFFAPAWAYGGMARSSAALCRALARRGHEVTVVTALLDPDMPMDETRDGVRVRRFRGPGPLKSLLVPWPWGLRAYLRREARSFDLAHLHGHRNGLAIVASHRL